MSAQDLLKGLDKANSFDTSAGSNPYYRIWIWKGDPSKAISAPMPENWSTSLDIGWQPQFANLIQEAAGAVVGQQRAQNLATLAAANGYQVQNKLLASNIWSGTSYITISIPFVFKVEKDVSKELLLPIKKLMSWALPTGGDDTSILLKAPYAPFESLKIDMTKAVLGSSNSAVTGSTSASGETAQPITVQFGNFFQLPSCVITSINQSYDSIFDKNGKPLSAKVDITVLSSTIITASDSMKMFI